MQLSLFLWCRHHCARDQSHRATTSKAIVCAIALGSPTLALAQSAASLPKVGLLAWDVCDAPVLIAGLKGLGRIPGETITIECRSAGGRDEGLFPAAVELARIPVDVIVSNSQPAGHAAMKATKTIPIVTIISGNPVAAGLAQSLARPVHNLTGISYYVTELTSKRLELLKEMVPGLSTIGVLANPKVSYLPFEEDTKRAATSLGVAVIIFQVREPSDLDEAFHQMKAQGAQAVFVLPDLMLAHEAKHIADLALAERLPMMAWGGWYTEVGGLMAYSADYSRLSRRLAFYVDRVLKGTKPGDLPIEQPVRFELSLNQRTARSLGLTIPPALLTLADRIVE
jgi:putative ABC transport system substrate-binding protein